MASNKNKSRTAGGIYGLSETPQQFFARIAEINRLEIMLKMQSLNPEQTERIERQIRWLKAINETDVIGDQDTEESSG